MARSRPFPTILALLFAITGPALAQAPDPLAVFHVSPDGQDGWSGTLAQPSDDNLDGPFLTLHRAQQAVRAVLRRTDREDIDTSKTTLLIYVELHHDLYELDRPLVFTPEDSGFGAGQVKWESARENRQVVLSGGRRIEGWEVGEDGRWRVVLPEVRDGDWYFSQLWVNDQRRFRPRLPEVGWFTVAEEIPPTEANAKRGHDRLGFRSGDIDPGWHALEDVEILGFHIWCASRMRIADIDTEGNTVSFTGPTRTLSPWAAFRKGNRYLAINVREALNEPGEWYLDRATGELTYIPLPGEAPEKVTVVAPRIDTLVRLQGEVAERRFVHHIHFKNIDFAHAGWNLPPEGQSFPQAEVHLGAAIEAVGARTVGFSRCGVRHTGQYGIALGAGCRGVHVDRALLADLGAGGIKVGTGGGAHSWMVEDFDPDDPESAVEDVIVRRSHLAHGGRLHPAAVGVWIGHAASCKVVYNVIHDFYYTGISVGWTWGYAEPSRSHHHEIAYNRITNIGQGVLSDMAGVYTLGVSPGTRVHHNVIQDVDAFDYGGWGLYTDEGSTGIEMTHNLVYRTKTGGFHQHYGRDNVIANNVFVEANIQQLQRTRTEEHRSFTFEKNIVYWTIESPLLGSNWRDDNFVLDRNVYWNPRFPDVRFPGDLTLEQWREQRGHDLESIVTDPRFYDAENGDFRLEKGTPAIPLGFEPWDYEKAGPRLPNRPIDDLPPVPAGFER